MAPDLFIFDAGGTKTDVLLLEQGIKKQVSLPGYNPNRPEKDFFSALKQFNFSKNSQIYFYGAGIVNQAQKNNIKKCFDTRHVVVNDDLLGAAIASFKNESGIVTIMGTGANIGFFDGKQITDKRGGYGYLIDDLGGGYELGKNIISGWLSGDFAPKTDFIIEDFLGVKKEFFIASFYQNINLGNIAGICKVVQEELDNDLALKNIVINYYDLFAKTHLIPFAKKHDINNISCVGAIAFYYKKYIEMVFSKNGMRIDSILLKPIEEIFKFHLTKL